MSKRLVQVAVIVGLFCTTLCARAQESPMEVSGCENPKIVDGKLIRVRGRLSVHFEDFSLGIPNCDSSRQAIWLAFGGDVPGIVPSTWNDNFRRPGLDIQVNGVSYGIKKDDNFRRLYALIASRHGDKPDYEVTATLTGMFFAGEESKDAKGNVAYSGYGHLGCCSLLLITQVSDVESVPPADLRLHGVVVGPDGKPVEGVKIINDVLGGSPPERQTTVTDKLGEFAFSTSGQQLRIENPNYRPLALTVKPGGAAVRVKLQEAEHSDWLIPACGNTDSATRIGFSVLFAIPQTMESSRMDDKDVQAQSFFVYPKGGSAPSAELIISHSADETKNSGDSLDFKWFDERWAKDTAGEVVGMDAHGQRQDGRYWRTTLFLGHEAATYWLQSGEKPDAYNRIIDSACIAKASTR